MKNFGIEFDGKFLTVVNGKVKKAFNYKQPALRWCLRYSVNKSNHVDLCYQTMDGRLRFYSFLN